MFTANTISGLATGITVLSIPWYFSHFLNKPSLFGWTYAVVTLISIFWSLVAGSLVDKYSRKTIFQFSTLLTSSLVGIAAFTGYYTGQVPVPFVILAFSATFLNFNIHYPNLYAFGQEITKRKDFGRVNSYIEIQNQATNALAGAMAAILLTGSGGENFQLSSLPIELPFTIPRWELHKILLLDAITYLFAFAVISSIRYRPLVKREPSAGNAWSRIKDGFSFLKERPSLFLFGLFSNTIFVVVLTHAFFLLAIYVNNHLEAKADVFGSAEMLFALGALGAGIAIRKIYYHINLLKGVLINTVIGAALLFWLALAEQYWVLFVFSLFLGLTNSGNRILRMTYIFNHIPNRFIGRSNSVFYVVGTVKRVIFIALFSLPFFSAGHNIVHAYTVLGFLAIIAVGILAAVYPRLPKTRG